MPEFLPKSDGNLSGKMSYYSESNCEMKSSVLCEALSFFEFITLILGILMGIHEQCQDNPARQQWLNEKEAASLISVSVFTLRQHRHKGIGLPYVKYGKSVRYSYADICAYLKSRTIKHNQV